MLQCFKAALSEVSSLGLMSDTNHIAFQDKIVRLFVAVVLVVVEVAVAVVVVVVVVVAVVVVLVVVVVVVVRRKLCNHVCVVP